MKAFWVPSKAPDARTNLEKPDSSTFCPASGKKLKLKDLIPLKFTQVPEGESGVHMDPVTKDNFTNASALVVLRPTGECQEAQCEHNIHATHDVPSVPSVPTKLQYCTILNMP